MKRSIASLFPALVALLLGIGTVNAAEPHPQLKLDDTGKWSVPLRYWFHPELFQNANGFAFLAEVTALGPEPASPTPDNLRSPEFRKGELTVIELLSRGPAVPARMADVRVLEVEGASGLAKGDRLIVLVAREPYEGGYVIDCHAGDCALGIPISPSRKAKLNADEEQVLIECFRGSKNSLAQMSQEQIAVWKKLNPAGVAAAYLRGK